MEFSLLLGVKVIHLIDRTDLFKICNVVLGAKIEKNEMGGACSLDGGGERCV
jgi:hypothetical protein